MATKLLLIAIGFSMFASHASGQNLKKAKVIKVDQKVIDDIYDQWYHQAVGGTLVSIANQLLSKQPKQHAQQVEHCTSAADGIEDYAKCLVPALKKQIERKPEKPVLDVPILKKRTNQKPDVHVPLKQVNTKLVQDVPLQQSRYFKRIDLMLKHGQPPKRISAIIKRPPKPVKPVSRSRLKSRNRNRQLWKNGTGSEPGFVGLQPVLKRSQSSSNFHFVSKRTRRSRSSLADAQWQILARDGDEIVQRRTSASAMSSLIDGFRRMFRVLPENDVIIVTRRPGASRNRDTRPTTIVPGPTRAADVLGLDLSAEGGNEYRNNALDSRWQESWQAAISRYPELIEEKNPDLSLVSWKQQRDYLSSDRRNELQRDFIGTDSYYSKEDSTRVIGYPSIDKSGYSELGSARVQNYNNKDGFQSLRQQPVHLGSWQQPFPAGAVGTAVAAGSNSGSSSVIPVQPLSSRFQKKIPSLEAILEREIQLLPSTTTAAPTTPTSTTPKFSPEELPRIFVNFVKQLEAGGNFSGEDLVAHVLSPSFLSVNPENEVMLKKGGVLSPSLFSLYNSTDSILPLPQLLPHLTEADRKSWIDFILDASRAKKLLNDTKQLFPKLPPIATPEPEKLVQKLVSESEEVNALTRQDYVDLYGNSTDQLFDYWQHFQRNLSEKQLLDLRHKGYAFMTPDQLGSFYGSEGAGANATLAFNVTGYCGLNDTERELHLHRYVLWLAEQKQASLKTDSSIDLIRRKRTIVGTPLVFTTATINAPATLSMLILLSPVVFSPIILSPAVLGPIILSPLLFSPIILSPRVLSPLILSPSVATPLILSPMVLCPLILSPAVMQPLILSPLVLSPLILSPGVMNPLILSPIVLNPLILSPQVLFALVLSPRVLSPLIESPLAVAGIVLSPAVLSRRRRRRRALYVLDPFDQYDRYSNQYDRYDQYRSLPSIHHSSKQSGVQQSVAAADNAMVVYQRRG